MPGINPVIELENDPVPLPSVDFDPEVTGVCDVLQQIPRDVIADPPSRVIFPPPDAVVAPVNVAAVVERVAK